MKKYIKSLMTFAGVLCMICASSIIIMAQNSVEEGKAQVENMTVDPVNAILAAAVAAVVGILVYIKRHQLKKRK